MMLKLLTLLGLATIRDCGGGLGRAPLLSFDSQPASPRAGDNVTLWVAYDLPAPAVTAGTATYSFSLNGIPFAPTVEDLCTQTACPIEVGAHNETSTSEFPSGVSGKIISQIAWRDQDNALLWCVETVWKV